MHYGIKQGNIASFAFTLEGNFPSILNNMYVKCFKKYYISIEQVLESKL